MWKVVFGVALDEKSELTVAFRPSDDKNIGDYVVKE